MVQDFDLDVGSLLAVEDLLDPKHMRRATQNTLNTVVTGYRKDSIHKAYRIFKLRKKRIRQDSQGQTTYVTRANRDRMEASINYKPRRPGLQNFGTRKTNPKKGSPKFKIKRSEANKELERGFYADMPKGGFGLWQRKGKGNRPFVRREGPGIKQMYEHKEVRVPLEKELPTIVAMMFDIKARDQLAKVRKR
jgi:hypothetical protein